MRAFVFLEVKVSRPEQAGDYDRLKDALLKRYLLSADGFKKLFRTAKPEA